MGEIARCQAKRKDGQPCTQPAGSSGYCWAHDPAYQQARLAGARKGGKNKSTAIRLAKLVPADLRAVFTRLEAALNATNAGDLEPKIANAMANVSRAMVAVIQAGEMEERLREIEETLNEYARARRQG